VSLLDEAKRGLRVVLAFRQPFELLLETLGLGVHLLALFDQLG
jgi:hypothetical protein